MDIRTEIYINQLAQGIADLDEGIAWFEKLGDEERRAVWIFLHAAVEQSHPGTDDVRAAVEKSGVKPTKTPCVLLLTQEVRYALTKIIHLPENERVVSFRVLIALLGVSDARRRASEGGPCEQHWWHRDLADPFVVAEIIAARAKRLY